MAKAGARVVAADLNVEGAEETARLCRAHGVVAWGHAHDVTSEEVWKDVMDAVAKATFLGNINRPLGGTHHAFDFAKYAHRYLAEARYRFNRCFSLRSILTRLLRAACLTSPTPALANRAAEVGRQSGVRKMRRFHATNSLIWFLQSPQLTLRLSLA